MKTSVTITPLSPLITHRDGTVTLRKRQPGPGAGHTTPPPLPGAGPRNLTVREWDILAATFHSIHALGRLQVRVGAFPIPSPDPDADNPTAALHRTIALLVGRPASRYMASIKLASRDLPPSLAEATSKPPPALCRGLYFLHYSPLSRRRPRPVLFGLPVNWPLPHEIAATLRRLWARDNEP